MKKWLKKLIAAVACYAMVAAVVYVGSAYRAFADYTATTGTGSTVFAFVCFTTKICPAQVLMNSLGAEIGNATTPVQVSIANTGSNTTPVQVQSNSSNLATSANQTNKTQFTQLTDGTNPAAAYTSYGTAPTGNVPGVNAFVTNTNANGPASAANSSPTVLPQLNHNNTSALGTSLVVKASPGNLNAANCTAITGGSAGYCVIINATSAPSNGATITPLDACYFDTTSRGCSLAHLNGSINYSSGIVVLVTSNASPFTYTTGTDTAFIEADYN